MATITISDIPPVGFELFADDESYMRDLANNEFDSVQGGFTTPICIYAGVLALESSLPCGTVAAAAVGGVIGWVTAGK